MQFGSDGVPRDIHYAERKSATIALNAGVVQESSQAERRQYILYYFACFCSELVRQCHLPMSHVHGHSGSAQPWHDAAHSVYTRLNQLHSRRARKLDCVTQCNIATSTGLTLAWSIASTLSTTNSILLRHVRMHRVHASPSQMTRRLVLPWHWPGHDFG